MVLHYSFNSQSSTVKLKSTELVLERLCLVLSWSQVPPAQLVLVPSTLRYLGTSTLRYWYQQLLCPQYLEVAKSSTEGFPNSSSPSRGRRSFSNCQTRENVKAVAHPDISHYKERFELRIAFCSSSSSGSRSCFIGTEVGKTLRQPSLPMKRCSG